MIVEKYESTTISRRRTYLRSSAQGACNAGSCPSTVDATDVVSGGVVCLTLAVSSIPATVAYVGAAICAVAAIVAVVAVAGCAAISSDWVDKFGIRVSLGPTSLAVGQALPHDPGAPSGPFRALLSLCGASDEPRSRRWHLVARRWCWCFSGHWRYHDEVDGHGYDLLARYSPPASP